MQNVRTGIEEVALLLPFFIVVVYKIEKVNREVCLKVPPPSFPSQCTTRRKGYASGSAALALACSFGKKRSWA